MKKNYYQKPDTKTVELKHHSLLTGGSGNQGEGAESRSVSKDWDKED